MITFISPKVNGRRKGPCLGIRYLMSSLKKADINSRIFEDVDIDDMSEDWFKSELIGISLQFVGQIEAAQLIIKLSRARNPDKLVIVGGPLIALLGAEARNYIDGDIFVSGEAEDCIANILIFGKKGSHISAIPPDLNCLEFPFRDDECLVGGLQHTSMITSRGCPNRCSFCATTMKGTWRSRSTENIVQEIDSLKKAFNIQAISFIDDNFLGSSEAGFQRAKDISDALITEKLDIYWSMECCTNDVSNDLFEKMQRAGLRRVLLGIESAVGKTRIIYGKKHEINGVMDAIELIKDLKIDISAGFIMFDPTTTADHLIANIDFLSKSRLATYASLTGFLTIYPNTPIAKYFIKRNLASQTDYRVKWQNSDERLNSLRRVFRLGFKPIQEFEAECGRSQFSALLRDDQTALSVARTRMDAVSNFLCLNSNILLEQVLRREEPWTEGQEKLIALKLSDKSFGFRKTQS